MSDRTASLERKTRETTIQVRINLDGCGRSSISTGLGFLDHMLNALALHSGIDIDLKCDGDLEVDDHHTVEDCALALGSALDSALGERSGIQRFGWSYAPLDESLARAVLDLSGRPFGAVHLDLCRATIGDVACENITHFFKSLTVTLRAAIHVDVLNGENDHHKCEAAFKALALALRSAVAQSPRNGIMPSTKGTLK